MTQFQVCEVFRLPTRGQCVIAGKETDGAIRSGMNARILLDDGLLWSIQMAAVEFIDRIATKESLLGLVCVEKTPEDASCAGVSAGSVLKLKCSSRRRNKTMLVASKKSYEIFSKIARNGLVTGYPY